MKSLRKVKFLILFLSLSFIEMNAQEVGLSGTQMQYFRDWSKKGINVFEPSKSDEQPAFNGLHLKIGADFTQNYQSLKHSNKPVYFAESETNPVNKNLLYGTSPADSTSATLSGFTTAMANLNLDLQIADGIRMSIETYMSTRHHNEFWVKGGYIQVDRLPMFGNPEWFSKYVRLKVGHFQPNYGDMQFRRSDAGNGMYNPFVENYILDAFTTEIGGELYIYPFKGLLLMGGFSNGTLHGNVDTDHGKPQPFTPDPTEAKPAIHAKIAYDGTAGDFRYRLAASIYSNSGSHNNTLYYGDRGGSQYMMIMEANRSLLLIDGIPSGIAQSTYTNNKDSGRFNPFFLSNVNSLMLNAFFKFKGLEFFGTYEQAKGRTWFEFGPTGPLPDREISQIGAELVYRFTADERVYLGVRYNTVTGTPQFAQSDASINRITAVAGWSPLDYLTIKLEYVTQEYKDFGAFSYLNEGKFSGVMLSATVGF